MGVTYKLTVDVLDYILDQKRNNQKLSAQKISDDVQSKFNVIVSKSSIHQALKEAGIITPRRRTPKETVIIPVDKKETLQNQMAKAAQDLVKQAPVLLSDPLESIIVEEIKRTPPPPASPPEPIKEEKVAQEIAPPAQTIESPKRTALSEKAIELMSDMIDQNASIETPSEPVSKKGPIVSGMGKIFLEAAHWEIGLENDAVIGNNAFFYFSYAYAFKLILSDGSIFWLDPFLSYMSDDFNKDKEKFHPRFLQRAIMVAIDTIASSRKSLTLNMIEENFSSNVFQKKIAEGILIKDLVIVDSQNQDITSFQINKKILSLDINYSNEIAYVNVASCHSDEILRSAQNDLILAQKLFFNETVNMSEVIDMQGFELNKDGNICISLLIPNTYKNIDSLNEAVKRVNLLKFSNHKNQGIKLKLIIENDC